MILLQSQPTLPDAFFYYALSGVLAAAFLGLIWAIFRHFISLLTKLEERMTAAEHKQIDHSAKLESAQEGVKRLERLNTEKADDIAEAIVAKIKAITPPPQQQWGHH